MYDIAENRVVHAFLAQGVADAMGDRFEFDDPVRQDVVDWLASNDEIQITDDTQMALFGAEALTNHLAHPGAYAPHIKQGYIDWYYTQRRSLFLRKNRGMGPHPFTLKDEPMMHIMRAPGMTCLESMGQHANMGHEALIDRQKARNGCGTVMRLLPFALHISYCETLKQKSQAYDMAQYASALTHRGEQIVPTTHQYMMKEFQHKVINKAKRITDLGLGWTAQECLNMGYWAFSKADTYDHMLVLAICHPGDSDSVAAVAGSLWGLMGKPIPQRQVARLKERHLIARVATSFHRALENAYTPL